MNSVLIGRLADGRLVELFIRGREIILSSTSGDKRGDIACLHSAVNDSFSKYRYSRLARTLAQSFLAEFPPHEEVTVFFLLN